MTLFPSQEPIAIIGIGCRFPGAITSPDTFWHFLKNGKDAIGEIPEGRWDMENLFDPNPRSLGHTYVSRGAFLTDVDGFDPELFGISPKEAASIDPQHRLLLQTSWEALENALRAPSRLRGSKTGVFVGIGQPQYAPQELYAADLARIGPYAGTGNLLSFASGRLAHVLGVRGPCMSIDTACSSSLVALHLACTALERGECEMALAAGVHLHLTPHVTLFLSRTGVLAPDGRSKAFDRSADGFGRGEGCGVLVLRRLSDARADGDVVLAVIAGSAVNSDGASSGFTVPDAEAQEQVIRAALRSARIEPNAVGFVETHGTGTRLGDPIEVEALANVFASSRQTPIALGSLKSSIGHLEAAAGIAGVIKAVLVLRHQLLPPQVGLSELTPEVPWESLPFILPTVLTEPHAELLCAGVSSFGMSGTNAHVVLERASEVRSRASTPLSPSVLALSAHNSAALQDVVRDMEHLLTALPPELFPDLCATSHRVRSTLRYRLAITATNQVEARDALREVSAGRMHPLVVRGDASFGRDRSVAFLFTGQGAQMPGMAAALYRTEPVFRTEIDRCAEILDPVMDLPLLPLLFEEANSATLRATRYAQPALFAVEWGLSALWKSWGVVPDVVLGHSLGEYVAACVAGCFSLEDGLKLVAVRGRLIQSLPANGAMASIRLSSEEVEELIAPYAGDLGIAAFNAPRVTVVSGNEMALEDLFARLSREGHMGRRLNVSHAFHSHFIDPILPDLRAALERVRFHTPTIAMVSNVSGEFVNPAELCDPDYWIRHTRQPVQFARGIQCLAEEDVSVFVEIGPQPVLIRLGQQVLPQSEILWLPSLLPGVDDACQMRLGLAALYAAGYPLDLSASLPGVNSFVNLPPYPFQNRSIRLELSAPALPPPEHSPVLKQLRQVALPPGKERYFEIFVLPTDPILCEHCIFGKVVIPAAWHIATLLAAMRLANPDCTVIQLQDISFVFAAQIPQEGLAIIISLSPGSVGELRFRLSSRIGNSDPLDASSWRVHVTGTSTVVDELEPIAKTTVTPTSLDLVGFYQNLERQGFELGLSFRWLRSLHAGSGSLLAECAPPSSHQNLPGMSIPTGLLDSCFQLINSFTEVSEPEAVFIPFRIGRLRMTNQSQSSPLTARAWRQGLSQDLDSSPPAGFVLLSADNMPIVEVQDFVFRLARKSVLASGAERLSSSFADPPSQSDSGSEWAAVLRALPAGKRRERLEGFVRELLAEVLNLIDPLAITPRSRFFEIGLDSIAAVEASEAIEAKLGVSVELTLLFDFPTLEALVDHLTSLLAQDPGKAAMLDESTSATLFTEYDPANLSDEEAERLLLQTLDRLE